MFKRRARIVFLDPGDGAEARQACAEAARQGGDWVEPAAAALQPAAAGAVAAWTEVAAADWDLVVAVDAAGDADWAALLPGRRVKVWDLGDCPDPAAEIPRRVAGLLGGFRMKAREDAADGE
jgi:hypothetical protein